MCTRLRDVFVRRVRDLRVLVGILGSRIRPLRCLDCNAADFLSLIPLVVPFTRKTAVRGPIVGVFGPSDLADGFGASQVQEQVAEILSRL